MTFASGYRGSVNGAVQTAYTDQPGIAVAGMIAFASDLNNVDSFLIAETNGIAAGKGVVFTANTDTLSLQSPPVTVGLPTGSTTAADFGGIMLFDEAMQSDENGVPGWADGRACRVLRPGRAGGRVYAKAVEAIDHTTDSVHLVITASETYEVGEFAPSIQGTVVQTATPVAGTNTGNGTLATVDATAGTATLGAHKLVCIEPGTNVGTFAHYSPSGIFLGKAVAGTEATIGGLVYTIADGATDFAAGDSFTVTVTESGAESVLLTNASWVTSAAIGGVAMIQLA